MKYKFHNLDLSYNQQVAITELWEVKAPRLVDVIQTEVEASLKVSFGWDNYHDCLALSITPKQEVHPFYGYVVSIKHQDFETLIKVMYWLGQGAWDKIEPPGKSDKAYDW